MLGALGGAFGVLLAWWLLRLLPSVTPGNIPRLDEIALDARVLGFASLLSVATGLVFGLAPAWQGARVDLLRAINETGVQATGGFRFTVRKSDHLVTVPASLRGVLVLPDGAAYDLDMPIAARRPSPGKVR